MDFLPFGIKDFLDIFLVSIIIYYLYRVMRSSGTVNIFVGILIFIILWIVVTQVVDMRLLGTILDKVMSVGAIALIVLFQNEIRRFLSRIGAQQRAHHLFRLFRKETKQETNKIILPTVMACLNMSKNKVGALIVLERAEKIDEVAHTGEIIDAVLSQRLIENLFFKNSPLHDGAMLVRGGRVYAAACILPVSHESNIPNKYGLRHRAALGISGTSDAVAVIVSEETGCIALAINGELHPNLSTEKLERLLTELLQGFA